MKFDVRNTRIFIKPGATDLRASKDEILHIVQRIMKQNPFSGAVFLFCNKNKTILKAIWWDKTGFWIAQKRIEKGKWPWPSTKEEARLITEAQFEMLLTGINFEEKQEELHFEKLA